MHPFVIGRSSAVLTATILFSVLAFNLLKKKKRAPTPSFISPTPTGEGNDHYDVFLSFRGLDTRKGFADHLYHSLDKAGIVPVFVFKDDKSIPIGKEFGPRILDAIARSKISILIISKNYASSKWCLRELIHIMDRAKSTSHIVLPIFYKVDPSDVRHLKGSFGKAFHSRKKYFDEEDIQKGQQALKEVSYLHGWESEKVANGHEGELVEKVIKNVLSKLSQAFQLDVTEHLVGIDDHVNKIMKWVDTPTTSARMIGIYGMGGIGKTTLAKRIYNQLLKDFAHHSFLADIRETACRKNIAYIQKQLIEDIMQAEPKFSNVDYGINWIKSRLEGKKVLILLDDIDHEDQLNALARKSNWFMAGSIIIVTTRNKAILEQADFEVDYKYELNELDMVQAMLLFNRHAFRTDYSLRDFEGISCDIISTMGGLPLAVKVVGSYLYKKMNREVWEDVLKKLKNQPHGDVQKTLRISFDALEDGHKQIFLDIVCFFIGIHDNGKSAQFAMYMWEDCGFYPSQGIEELKLRCLIKIGDHGGFMMHDQLRDLGRSIFCQGQPLEKRSGPWDKDYEGVPRVLIRHMERHPRFHDFLGAASSGHSKQLLSEVRWLKWYIRGNASFSTANLHLPKLSVLNLYARHVTEDWEGWGSLMASKQLKVFDLLGCRDLRCTLDLSAFTQLKILILKDCWSLEHLHPSIGKLTSLVSLDLACCWSLKKLPEEVGQLKNLEKLSLEYIGIIDIPSSIGSLRKLEKLTVLNCNSLREIPSSIGDLQNLQHLNLVASAIEKLPSAIGRLKNLRTLELRHCGSLKGAIPSEIGDLPSLKIPNLNGTTISDLLESVWNLSSLQRLDLWGYEELRSLPKLPSSLQSLDLRDCKELRSLLELPSSLKSLKLLGCEELQSLPELPSGLTDLSVTCQSLGLPQLLSLIYLKKLHLKVRHLLEDIRELSSIPLKLCFEEWDKLTSLSLEGLMHLEELSIKKCSSLEFISLRDCNSIERLCCLELPCLKELAAVICDNLVEIEGLDGAKFLEKLDFSACISMDTLPDLTGCEKLQSLVVQDCKNLTQLQGLEMLNLSLLNISGCDSLEAIPKLSRTHIRIN